MTLRKICLGLLLLSLGCRIAEQDSRTKGNSEVNAPMEQAQIFENAVPLEGELSHLVVEDTPYYKDGPQQGRPPDGTLARGSKVRVDRSSGSYTLIVSDTGVKAYVATAALKSLATP